MRIAILTLPLHTNYGGILQAYALQTILQRMGHEVKVLYREYVPVRVSGQWARQIKYSKRWLQKYVFKRGVEIRREERILRELSIMRQCTSRFIEKYISLYPITDFSAISSSAFDAIVVGSDQIWRPQYIRQLWGEKPSVAFLSFAQGWPIVRIAYAASFGVDSWEFAHEETLEIQKLAQLFNAISVREKSGIELSTYYLRVSAEQVLDPTLLLSRDDYDVLIGNQPKSEGTLLTYILDETDEKRNFVKHIAEVRNLVPFSVIARHWSAKCDIEERIQPPVEKWLAGFRDAEFVVTDSFHACVFCIIFGKPFVAIGNVQRGLSRFESLLGDLGLQNNLLASLTEYDATYDYRISTHTYELLETKRQASMAFLNKINKIVVKK